MKPRERVSTHEFTIDTARSADEIHIAGQRAIDAGKRFLSNTVTERHHEGNAIGYVIKGPGSLVQQMALTVHWKELENGSRRVTLEVHDFRTVQSTFLFIPIGPKEVPALGSLKRFSHAFREELQ